MDRYSNWPKMDPRGSLKYSNEHLQPMESLMNYPLMEAPSLLPIPQGHFYPTGASTIYSALWPSLTATVDQSQDNQTTNT